MKDEPLLYRVKLGWDEKYILHTYEKLNVKNDNDAKKAARRIASLGGFSCYETLVYREGKNLPERI